MQASLPFSFAGLGLLRSSVLAPAAFTSSVISFLHTSELRGVPSTSSRTTVPHLLNSIRATLSNAHTSTPIFNSWLQSGHLDPPPEKQHASEKWWAALIHRRLQDALVSNLSLRDRCRYACQRTTSTGVWLAATPSRQAGTWLSPAEFTTLAKWHLGLPLVNSAQCHGCGQQQDPLGDHAVTCRHSKPWARHQQLAHALAQIAADAGITVQTEVALPNSVVRPADLLLSSGTSGHTAVDVTVRHPITPSTAHSEQSAAGTLVSAA